MTTSRQTDQASSDTLCCTQHCCNKPFKPGIWLCCSFSPGSLDGCYTMPGGSRSYKVNFNPAHTVKRTCANVTDNQAHGSLVVVP